MHISVKVSEGSEATVHAQKETAIILYREIKKNKKVKGKEISYEEAIEKTPNLRKVNLHSERRKPCKRFKVIYLYIQCRLIHFFKLIVIVREIQT